MSRYSYAEGNYFLTRFLCRHRAFRLEQSREQYLLLLRASARPPFGPLSHLNHAQSVEGEPAKEDFPELPPGGFSGRTDGHPAYQQRSICAGTHTDGRWRGQIQSLSFLQYGLFNIISNSSGGHHNPIRSKWANYL